MGKKTKEEILSYILKWQRDNPEKRKAIQKKYDSTHPEINRAKLRRYEKRYPEKINAKTARRRAAKLKALPAWANEFFISEAYHLARLRTKKFGFKWQVDHIVPLRSQRVCGLHVENNLQVIPAKQNNLKSNIYWPDMS